ncbi:MAG: hypothetical protein KIT69_13605, partial [Propionibacteriaceae bacterium]|nr:hypothetical protein [Propionibacteriaceae bacterium]
MTTIPAEDEYGDPIQQDRSPLSDVLQWAGLLAVLAVVVGGLTAVLWAGLVDLPVYRIKADGSAAVSERAYTEFIQADAWFVVCGLFVGVGLGIVSWKWFKPLGWPTALFAAGAGLLSAIVCWKFGELLGPAGGTFVERLAKGAPGEVVPIDLTLRALSAPAVWAFAAVTPVLLAAS